MKGLLQTFKYSGETNTGKWGMPFCVVSYRVDDADALIILTDGLRLDGIS